MVAATQYEIDRKTAAKMLGVSVRTLDRYLKSKKLSSQVVDGRVWLSRGELSDFMSGKVAGKVVLSTMDLSTVNSVSTVDSEVDNIVDTSPDNVEIFNDREEKILSQKRTRPNSNLTLYKNLFEEAQDELEEKRERLEILNYRIGQLEAQLKTSVPMLQYYNEKAQNKQEAENLQQQLSDAQQITEKFANSLKYERFSKRIFMIALLTILALQPLWLLVLYR